MPTTGWWEALWPDPASVIAAVGITRGMEVIDLCSGDGWFTLPIAKLARHVIAIDIDPALLEVARMRLTASSFTNCDYRLGDAYQQLFTLAGRMADFVFMANAFHGVHDRPRLASAVHKTLKPSGRFAVVNWHPRPREETTVLGEARGPRTELRLSAQQTIESVVAAGFTPAAVVEILPYHYGAIFERTAP